MNNLYIGIDVGKRHDPSAIAVCDCESRRVGDQIKGHWESHYVFHYLRRLELGTPYPDQATQIMAIIKAGIRKFRLNHAGDQFPPRVMIDVTGVGDAMTDLLIAAGIRRLGVLYPCRFVGGDHFYKNGLEINIGKELFVSRMQAKSEGGRLHLPQNHPEAAIIKKEMLDFDVDVDENSGKASYGAMRPGTHDDQVTAVGLACFVDPLKNMGTNPLSGADASWQDFTPGQSDPYSRGG